MAKSLMGFKTGKRRKRVCGMCPQPISSQILEQNGPELEQNVGVQLRVADPFIQW